MSPGWGVYCATKFAVEGLSEALRAELEPLGIRAATSASPPLRLPLGSDCVARVESKVAHVAAELATWRSLALSTDHDAPARVVMRETRRSTV